LSASTSPPEQPGGPPGGRAQARATDATGQPTRAAVLVPLFMRGEPATPHIVLTRRRADLRRHAGEISFPGGRHDDTDSDLAATALREAEEEIGLAREHVSLLGELPRVSTFATGYVIHPFVGAIPEGLAWRLSPLEVDEVLELPVQAVRDSATRTNIQRRGITFETDAFVLDGNVIWGATARIIQLLLLRLEPDSLQLLAEPAPG
jgi:8-oxo-dGTP pyrophosphatase MutT (NUDIX family)